MQGGRICSCPTPNPYGRTPGEGQAVWAWKGLPTYSEHIAIEEKTRNKFFSEIKSIIDNFGGKITIYDTIDLQLARKP